MKKIQNGMPVLLVIVAAMVGGCHPTHDESRKELSRTWGESRAGLMLDVAQRRYKAGDMQGAKKAAGEALERNPENEAARILMARVCIELGQFKQALQELGKIQVYEETETAEAQYLRGVANERLGRANEAIKCYARALEIDKNYLDAVQATAEILMGEGQTEEALRLMKRHEGNPEAGPGFFELAGRIAFHRKEFNQAVEYLQQACDLDMQNWRYEELLASALQASGRYAQALDVMRRLMLNDKYAPPAWVLVLQGNCNLALKYNQNALKSFEKACETDPESVHAWLGLAKANLANRLSSRALEAANRARKMDPKNLDAAILVSYALLRQGNVSQAVSVLTSAQKLYPKDSTLACLLGRAHEAAGQSSKAIKQYAAAVSMDPKNQLARALLRQARAN